MNAAVKILVRCLAIEFYKQNSALFGLLILIFFGFIKSSEHVAIGSFLVSNPSSLLFLYVIWLGYLSKVLLFIRPTLKKEENQFLEAFALLVNSQKYWSVTVMTLMLMIPITGYSIFLVMLSFIHSFYFSAVSLVFALAIAHILLVSILLSWLHKVPFEKKFIQIALFNKLTRPSYLFFIEYLIRNEFVLLALTKTYSVLMIIGTASLFVTEQFDLRLYSEGILLASVSHVTIIHKYVRFRYHDLKIQLNLPQSITRVYFMHTLTITLILLPELLVMIRHYPLNFMTLDIIGIVAFCIAIVLLIYGMSLMKQVELSNSIVQIFWLVVGTTFLILFSIHPLLLAAMFILFSFGIMYLRHYKFEYVEKN